MTRYGMNCVNIKTISLNSKSILFPRYSDVVMVGDGGGGEGLSLIINNCLSQSQKFAWLASNVSLLCSYFGND